MEYVKLIVQQIKYIHNLIQLVFANQDIKNKVVFVYLFVDKMKFGMVLVVIVYQVMFVIIVSVELAHQIQFPLLIY